MCNFHIGKPAFNHGPRNLPRNPPDNIIQDIQDFDNLIYVDKLFVKALKSYEIFGKLVSSFALPYIIFDIFDIFHISYLLIILWLHIPVSILVADFNFS